MESAAHQLTQEIMDWILENLTDEVNFDEVEVGIFRIVNDYKVEE